MRRSARRYLFVAAVVVFLISSAVIVLYAVGYHWDSETERLLLSGSIHMKSNQQAEVLINEKSEGETSYFGNFSLGQLLPGTYEVQVQKKGYSGWSKSVIISPGEYSDFPYVVILPESLSFEVVATASFPMSTPVNVASFSFGFPPYAILSPDKMKVAWIEAGVLWAGWLKNTDEQPYKTSGAREKLLEFKNNDISLYWYKDSAHLLTYDGFSLRLIEIDTRGGVNIIPMQLTTGIFRYDESSNALYVMQANKEMRASLD